MALAVALGSFHVGCGGEPPSATPDGGSMGTDHGMGLDADIPDSGEDQGADLGPECTGVDTDGDGVRDICDACPGEDDSLDEDADSVPDACDECDDSDDRVDADGDGVADGCDVCAGSDDALDTDMDGIPDGCDCDLSVQIEGPDGFKVSSTRPVVLRAPVSDTYAWSTGATGRMITVDAPGTYTLRVTLGGCIGDASADVAANVPPTLELPAAVNYFPATGAVSLGPLVEDVSDPDDSQLQRLVVSIASPILGDVLNPAPASTPTVTASTLTYSGPLDATSLQSLLEGTSYEGTYVPRGGMTRLLNIQVDDGWDTTSEQVVVRVATTCPPATLIVMSLRAAATFYLNETQAATPMECYAYPSPLPQPDTALFEFKPRTGGWNAEATTGNTLVGIQGGVSSGANVYALSGTSPIVMVVTLADGRIFRLEGDYGMNQPWLRRVISCESVAACSE